MPARPVADGPWPPRSGGPIRTRWGAYAGWRPDPSGRAEGAVKAVVANLAPSARTWGVGRRSAPAREQVNWIVLQAPASGLCSPRKLRAGGEGLGPKIPPQRNRRNARGERAHLPPVPARPPIPHRFDGWGRSIQRTIRPR